MSEAAPAPADPGSPLAALGPLLDRLEVLLATVEEHEPEVRDQVFEMLDAVDAVHRVAVLALARAVGADVAGMRAADPAVDWLFQAYGVGVSDIDAASAALEQIRPYLHEHGGEVTVLAVDEGIVRVRMTGACSGCTSAGETLRHGIVEALRENLPGFVAIDVAPDDAASHPPPEPVLLQISHRPV